ncbi:hypothetical protein TWF481_010443 [Arthrobotrys musiformis]|uniref:Vacuolar calcium ion transporter n=1 Tax=Arthrobotrys musiformis TaxID=47236 RepID=A0AAV9W2N2_9PEZI
MDRSRYNQPVGGNEVAALLVPDNSEPLPHLNNSTQRSVLFNDIVRSTVPYLVNAKALWIFAPLSLASRVFHWSSISTSIFSILAIIPLSAILSNASDKLSDASGDLLGALVNATFGNIVELTIGILAVIHGDTAFAQSVMLGSILSDVLLVLGCCFFSAAWRMPIVELSMILTGTFSSLMIITTVALIIPTVLSYTFGDSEPNIDKQIISFSRGTAVVLLILYIAYLYFEFVTHKELFEGEPEETAGDNGEDDSDAPPTPIAPLGPWQHMELDMRKDTPSISGLLGSFGVFISSALAIVLFSRFLFDSINETSKTTHISRTFIAIILIPIASNSLECVTVVRASESGRVEFAVGVIVDSILQIALFVLPALVILGWVFGQAMTLDFEAFQAIIMFLTILLVNHLLSSGIYTYMHGILLVAWYVIIAAAFFLRGDI